MATIELNEYANRLTNLEEAKKRTELETKEALKKKLRL